MSHDKSKWQRTWLNERHTVRNRLLKTKTEQWWLDNRSTVRSHVQYNKRYDGTSHTHTRTRHDRNATSGQRTTDRKTTRRPNAVRLSTDWQCLVIWY